MYLAKLPNMDMTAIVSHLLILGLPVVPSLVERHSAPIAPTRHAK
jgi:hypothetical protein